MLNGQTLVNTHDKIRITYDKPQQYILTGNPIDPLNIRRERAKKYGYEFPKQEDPLVDEKLGLLIGTFLDNSDRQRLLKNAHEVDTFQRQQQQREEHYLRQEEAKQAQKKTKHAMSYLQLY